MYYKYNVYSISNVRAHTITEEGLERPKHLDGNVCSCPCYILTIGPEKYISCDEAVWSNTILLTNWCCISYNRSLPQLEAGLEFKPVATPFATSLVFNVLRFIHNTLKVHVCFSIVETEDIARMEFNKLQYVAKKHSCMLIVIRLY